MSCVVQLRVSEHDPRPIFAVWHTFAPLTLANNMDVLRGQPAFKGIRPSGTVDLCGWCPCCADVARQLREDGIDYHIGIHETCAEKLLASDGAATPGPHVKQRYGSTSWGYARPHPDLEPVPPRRTCTVGWRKGRARPARVAA
jgi:hypothetical protein